MLQSQISVRVTTTVALTIRWGQLGFLEGNHKYRLWLLQWISYLTLLPLAMPQPLSLITLIIPWKLLQYHGLQEEDLKKKSKKESVEELEDDRMMKNAWRVAEEVRLRIDGEPAPKGFLHAIVSERQGEEFFYNKDHLSKYNSTSKSKQHKIPEHAYFNSVESFFWVTLWKRRALHWISERGLYKKRRTVWHMQRKWMVRSIQESLKRTPRPYPDATQLPS